MQKTILGRNGDNSGAGSFEGGPAQFPIGVTDEGVVVGSNDVRTSALLSAIVGQQLAVWRETKTRIENDWSWCRLWLFQETGYMVTYMSREWVFFAN